MPPVRVINDRQSAVSPSSTRCETWKDLDHETCRLSDLGPQELFKLCDSFTDDPSDRDEMHERWNGEGNGAHGDYVRLAEDCISREALRLEILGEEGYREDRRAARTGRSRPSDPGGDRPPLVSTDSDGDPSDLEELSEADMDRVFANLEEFAGGADPRELFELDPDAFWELVARFMSTLDRTLAGEDLQQPASDSNGAPEWTENVDIELIFARVEEFGFAGDDDPRELFESDPGAFWEFAVRFLAWETSQDEWTRKELRLWGREDLVGLELAERMEEMERILVDAQEKMGTDSTELRLLRESDPERFRELVARQDGASVSSDLPSCPDPGDGDGDSDDDEWSDLEEELVEMERLEKIYALHDRIEELAGVDPQALFNSDPERFRELARQVARETSQEIDNLLDGSDPEPDVDDLLERMEMERISAKISDLAGMDVQELFMTDPDRFSELAAQAARDASDGGSVCASDPADEVAFDLDDVWTEAVDDAWSESGLADLIEREKLMSVMESIMANVERSTGRDPMEVQRTDPELFRELVAQVLVKEQVMSGDADPGDYIFYDGTETTVIDAEVHWAVAVGVVLGLIAFGAAVWFMPRLFPKKRRRVALRPPSGHVAVSNGNEETKKQGRRRKQKPQQTRAEGAAVDSPREIGGGRGKQGQRKKLSRSERIRNSRARRGNKSGGAGDGPPAATTEASPQQELAAVLGQIDARTAPPGRGTPELTDESDEDAASPRRAGKDAERPTADDSESDDRGSTVEEPRGSSASAPPPSDVLRRVLTAAEHCLTCPPSEYGSWLRSELDIETSADLVEASLEDIDMLSSGEGGGPGIKEGREDDFRFVVQNYERFLAGMSQARARLSEKTASSSSSSDGPSSDGESDEGSDEGPESEPAASASVDVDPSLLAVLECCSSYLTCSAYDYATWLVRELDVASPEDLAEALREDVCLSAFTSSLTGGNGSSSRRVVGVREGAEENFRQAALRLIVVPDQFRECPQDSSFENGLGKRAESDQKASLPQCTGGGTGERGYGWACPVCTLVNPQAAARCAACDFDAAPSPAGPSEEEVEAAERRRRKREAKKARAAEARAARLAEARREEEENRRAAEEGRTRRLAARRDRESSTAAATEPEDGKADNADAERMRRLLEEERRKAAAARERKDWKKSRRLERKVAEQEAEWSRRADHWRETLDEDSRRVDLISRLIATEVLRQSCISPDSSSAVISRQDLYLISDAARQANLVLFGGLPSRRVRIDGMERPHTDLNGRTGSVRSWDGSRGTFVVVLDAKRSKEGGEERRISPQHLEEIHDGGSSRSRNDAGARYTVPENRNILTSDGKVIGCGQFDLTRSDVDWLRTKSNVDSALALFRRRRDVIDARLAEEQRREEREQQQEEADRRRRAARRAEDRARKERARTERADARKRQEQEARAEYERELAELQEARATLRRALVNKMKLRVLLFEAAAAGVPEGGLRDFLEGHGVDYGLFDEDDRDFAESFSEFRARFDFGGDGEDEEEEEDEAAYLEAAEALGIETDADERTVRAAYRRLALAYHPDKWRSDADHGLSRDEAMERFRRVQDAYDRLMMKFDDESDFA